MDPNLDASEYSVNSMLGGEEGYSNGDTKPQGFRRRKIVLAISVAVLLVIGILLIWGFSTKKNDPINPPEPISN